MDSVRLLEGRRVALGITGGIAAYKVCSLASHLTQAGALVDVIMTDAATRFVAPLSFRALTGRPVYTSMWDVDRGDKATHIAHIGLGHAADLLVIAPATANTLVKLALGLADNLLSTVALAARCPLLVAPAMDVGMWSHPATQANVETLRKRGVHFAGPAHGRMASGFEGKGRLLEPDQIMGHVRLVLGSGGPLSGWTVVVTAGPTRERIDPVRFLSNPSTGRQGYALAQAALDRGAEVKLVSGPTHLAPPVGAEVVQVTTAREMQQVVLDLSKRADALFMTAAVADFRPHDVVAEKIKKAGQGIAVDLERTDDILTAVSEQRARSGRPGVVVGFAAETEDVLNNARIKLQRKDLDLVVANDVTAPDAGFAVNTNRVVLLDRDGGVKELPLMSKASVAEAVLDRVLELFGENSGT